LADPDMANGLPAGVRPPRGNLDRLLRRPLVLLPGHQHRRAPAVDLRVVADPHLVAGAAARRRERRAADALVSC